MEDLEDFVCTYPNYSDPNLQSIIYSKREFRELKSYPKEEAPKIGKKYRHQEAIARLMIFLDTLILFHKTGTGKSCASISPYEYVIDLMENFTRTLDNPEEKPIKGCYVLVHGVTHEEEFKRQIYEKCSMRYKTEKIESSISVKAYKGNITRALNKFYTFITYGVISKKIQALREGRSEKDAIKAVKEEFSGYYYILDEAHNIKLKTKNPDDEDKYNNIQFLFNHIVRSKKIIMTATPAVNDVREIADLINLIKKQGERIDREEFNKIAMLIEKNNEIINSSELNKYIQKHFGGLVSYVRELDIGVDINYVGENISEGYYTKVFPVEMDPFQYEVYKQAEKEKPSFQFFKIQASGFVYPDGTTADVGFENNIMKDPQIPYLYYWRTEEIKNEIRLNIGKYSCKMAAIIDLELKAYSSFNQITQSVGAGGKAFIYAGFKVNWGVYEIGMCLELFGFERYNSKESVFISGKNYLGGETEEEISPYRKLYKKERKVSIRKGLRYAIISPEIPEEIKASTNALFNSYENRFGEYIQIIIGSEVTKEAINFTAVRRIYKTVPPWNRAGDYQSESRALRSTSHVDLNNELEMINEKFAKEGKPLLEKYDVSIYNMVSVAPQKTSENVSYNPLSFTDIQFQDFRTKDDYEIELGNIRRVVDVEMFAYAEKKHRRIAIGERILKRSAVDYYIHEERNIRENDKDYTPNSDYMSSKYFALCPKTEQIDSSNYDVLYSSAKIRSYIVKIRILFSNVEKLSIEEIYKKLDNGEDSKFIRCALTQIILNRIVITDKFGFDCHLNEDRDYYFITREFINTGSSDKFKYLRSNLGEDENLAKIMSNYGVDLKRFQVNDYDTETLSLSHYLSNLTIIEKKDLESYIRDEELKNFSQELQESLMLITEETSQRIDSLFKIKSQIIKIHILENFILLYFKAFMEKIINYENWLIEDLKKQGWNEQQINYNHERLKMMIKDYAKNNLMNPDDYEELPYAVKKILKEYNDYYYIVEEESATINELNRLKTRSRIKVEGEVLKRGAPVKSENIMVAKPASKVEEIEAFFKPNTEYPLNWKCISCTELLIPRDEAYGADDRFNMVKCNIKILDHKNHYDEEPWRNTTEDELTVYRNRIIIFRKLSKSTSPYIKRALDLFEMKARQYTGPLLNSSNYEQIRSTDGGADIPMFLYGFIRNGVFKYVDMTKIKLKQLEGIEPGPNEEPTGSQTVARKNIACSYLKFYGAQGNELIGTAKVLLERLREKMRLFGVLEIPAS